MHHKPLLNGVSSFIPPAYERLRALYEQDPIPDALFDLLESDRAAIVVVHAGALRERAELFERGDVRAVLPWAPPGSIKGFAVDVTRPPFIDGDTDSQVEIVDARGASRLMPPLFFVWRDTVTVEIEWDPERLAALLARLGADPDRDADRVLAGTAAKSRVLALVAGGAPRERVISAVIDSAAFRRAHSRRM